MKGMQLTIQSVVIIILAVLLLVVAAALWFETGGVTTNEMTDRRAWNSGCLRAYSAGCPDESFQQDGMDIEKYEGDLLTACKRVFGSDYEWEDCKQQCCGRERTTTPEDEEPGDGEGDCNGTCRNDIDECTSNDEDYDATQDCPAGKVCCVPSGSGGDGEDGEDGEDGGDEDEGGGDVSVSNVAIHDYSGDGEEEITVMVQLSGDIDGKTYTAAVWSDDGGSREDRKESGTNTGGFDSEDPSTIFVTGINVREIVEADKREIYGDDKNLDAVNNHFHVVVRNEENQEIHSTQEECSYSDSNDPCFYGLARGEDGDCDTGGIFNDGYDCLENLECKGVSGGDDVCCWPDEDIEGGACDGDI